MEALLDVVSVQSQSEYILHLEFENGEKRSFDMSEYMTLRPFNRLAEKQLFSQASVENGTVVWPGNIDIAPETLYCRSTPL